MWPSDENEWTKRRVEIWKSTEQIPTFPHVVQLVLDKEQPLHRRREDAKFFNRNYASTTKNSTFVERRHAAVSATRAADVYDSRVISVGKDFDTQPSLEAAWMTDKHGDMHYQNGWWNSASYGQFFRFSISWLTARQFA
jgi:hypothetical protein